MEYFFDILLFHPLRLLDNDVQSVVAVRSSASDSSSGVVNVGSNPGFEQDTIIASYFRWDVKP